MNDLVMYVGVNNKVYICICKHGLMYEQDGATCRYDMISIYVYMHM